MDALRTAPAVLAFLVLHAIVQADSPDILEVGTFSAATEGGALPEGWKPLTFKKIDRQTRYRLVKEDGVVVVQAVSEASASGLTREIRVDPREYPVIQWRWKVAALVEKSDVTRKKGDDYPARLYVTFEYDPAKVGLLERARFESIRLLYGQYPPIGALTYIWDGKAPKGTIVPNAYTDRVRMIVLESGGARLNQWITEERNLFDDYKQVFGEEPTRLSGVAVMTDTDDTGESAIAYYGDIVLKKGP
jgi:hypothetical protein